MLPARLRLGMCVFVGVGADNTRDRGSRRGRRDEEEEEEEKRMGGGWRGKPIIVQITGRLWIFYQASSAALPFCSSPTISVPLSL